MPCGTAPHFGLTIASVGSEARSNPKPGYPSRFVSVMKRLLLAHVVAVIVALWAVPLEAQLPLTPRALGTGDAYLGIARGQEALWTNPANLALSGNPTWSLTLGHVAVGGTAVGPELRDIVEVMLLDDRDVNRRQELLSAVPSEGMALTWGANVPLASLQIGRFAIGLSANGTASQNLDRDVVDLLMSGYEEGREDYVSHNTGGSHAAYLALSTAYARTIGQFAVGVTGRYLRGYGQSQYRFTDARYETGASHQMEVGIREMSADRARGFSLDLGAAMEPLPNLTVGAVLENAVGSLAWDDRYVREITVTERDFQQGWEAIADRFADERRSAGPDDAPLGRDLRLPTMLRMGGGYAPWNGGRLGASFRTTLRNGELGGPWTTSAGIGFQQRLVIIGVRAGIASNLSGGTLVSGGANLGPLEVGVGKINGNRADAANGWIVTTGLQVRGRMRS